MRVGHNPNRANEAQQIKPIVLSMITHLPNFEGYHKYRFDVVKQCLKSMTENANVDHSLLVWDNGSHPKFREWVRDEINPDIFIESANVGKSQARRMYASMLPPETILGVSDDDMLFSENWLIPQVELMAKFPNVASVTGYVVRTSFRWGCENTIKWARDCGIMEAGRFLSDESEQEFCRSIGRDYQIHKQGTEKDLDYRATYNGATAYLTSHHCQFIGRAGLISKIPTNNNLAMGDEKGMDIFLDHLGLRLGTTERLARHVGNVPD